MSTPRTIRTIAAGMPRSLKALRAKLMFERCAETLGVDEVICPACRGEGLLDDTRLERCPVCCGFGEVPEGLADWFASCLHRMERHEDSRGGAARKGPRRPAALRRALSSADDPPVPRGERLGRLAGPMYKVVLPGRSRWL